MVVNQKINCSFPIKEQPHFILYCMEDKPIINVTCAIIKDGDKILVAQRSESMSLPLKWEFPGGKIDGDEPAEDCIQRELREELNIEVKIISRLSDAPHDYGKVIINLIPFIVEYVSGILLLSEHKQALWLPVHMLGSLDWADADVPVLTDFINNYDA